jgi:hypothetical protein
MFLHDRFAPVKRQNTVKVPWWREKRNGDTLSLAALKGVPVTPMVADTLRGIPTKITEQTIDQSTTPAQNLRHGSGVISSTMYSSPQIGAHKMPMTALGSPVANKPVESIVGNPRAA